jgi:hypothetical protein
MAHRIHHDNRTLQRRGVLDGRAETWLDLNLFPAALILRTRDPLQ